MKPFKFGLSREQVVTVVVRKVALIANVQHRIISSALAAIMVGFAPTARSDAAHRDVGRASRSCTVAICNTSMRPLLIDESFKVMEMGSDSRI